MKEQKMSADSYKGKENATEDGNCHKFDESYAVITLPKCAVEAVLLVKVYDGGELKNVERKMSMADIQFAFQEADYGYIPEDAVFRTTAKGLRELEKTCSGN